MSRVKEADIWALLERWSQAKTEMREIEKRIEKYKRLAKRVMDSQDINNLSSDCYTLKRKNISRTTISKRDVPDHIWEKYARKCSYPVYYLSEISI